jgi:hypothetical protein
LKIDPNSNFKIWGFFFWKLNEIAVNRMIFLIYWTESIETERNHWRRTPDIGCRRSKTDGGLVLCCYIAGRRASPPHIRSLESSLTKGIEESDAEQLRRGTPLRRTWKLQPRTDAWLLGKLQTRNLESNPVMSNKTDRNFKKSMWFSRKPSDFHFDKFCWPRCFDFEFYFDQKPWNRL